MTPNTVGFSSALTRIIERCQTIQSRDAEADSSLSVLFSGRELEMTVGLCLDFLHAVGDFPASDGLDRHHDEIVRLRNAVLTADDLIARRIPSDSALVGCIIACESTFFDLLLNNDPTFFVLAALALKFEPLVRSFLTTALSEVGCQLAESESIRFSRPWKDGARIMASLILPGIKKVLEDSAKQQQRSFDRARREILKSVRAPIDEDFTIVGPKTLEQCSLVREVVCHIAGSKTPVSFYKASRAVFKKLPNGYSSAHVLEKWCVRNADKMRRWISSYRLGNPTESRISRPS